MSKIDGKKQKVFVKGREYRTDDLLVLCTETTCNYSNEHFKAVVLSSKKFTVGSVDEFFMHWFEEEKEG
jgi:hypothetical protein|tara:strand:+ start:8561 stop:8767 length:207 start_codon:yes stop_codon:yes gene_type:complete